jgi:hypothetical protein
MIKLRIIKWTEHVAQKREIKMSSQFWSENLKARERLEHLGVHGKDIIMNFRDVNWVHRPRGRDQWRAFVKTV